MIKAICSRRPVVGDTISCETEGLHKARVLQDRYGRVYRIEVQDATWVRTPGFRAIRDWYFGKCCRVWRDVGEPQEIRAEVVPEGSPIQYQDIMLTSRDR